MPYYRHNKQFERGEKMNLKRQFYYAIEKCCKFGADKHSIKHQKNYNKSNIYSYSDRKNLLNIYSQFGNHIKDNFPNVKMSKDITNEHIQSFLSSKSRSCSNETLKSYFSAFIKLGHIINNTYHTHSTFNSIVIPVSKKGLSKIRDVSMSKEDYGKIQTYLNNSKGSGRIGLEIAKITGMRTEEICKLKFKDIKSNGKIISVVDGKGKRSREIPIYKIEDISFFKCLLNSSSSENERICPIQPDSLNKAIRRAIKALGIDKKYKDTTIHSIRKMYAQNLYNDLRNQGFTSLQSWNNISANLGHGENRQDLLHVYLSDLW